MGEAEEERLELRLLSDPSFSEEFDTIVDEITDQYVGGDLQEDERKRVEQYFLKSSERQQKVRFTSELLQRAELERGAAVIKKPVQPVPSKPGFFERAMLFWRSQPSMLRLASAVATIVIFAGVALLLIPRNGTSGPYSMITLTMANSDRATGPEIKPVKLGPDVAGIRIELTLPEQTSETQTYRIELLDEQGAARDLPLAERTTRSLIVALPANEISRGSYSIRLYRVNPEGGERRIPGSYFFSVE